MSEDLSHVKSQLERDLYAAETETIKLKSRIESLEQELDKCNKKIDEQDSEVDRLANEVYDLRQRMEEVELWVAELRETRHTHYN